ncbi:MAG: hypothetical protein HRT38_20060 [Alteromonadaceae bacterium]|nr:hypothetical protein [Alteromonadaceae bacterium]
MSKLSTALKFKKREEHIHVNLFEQPVEHGFIHASLTGAHKCAFYKLEK